MRHASLWLKLAPAAVLAGLLLYSSAQDLPWPHRRVVPAAGGDPHDTLAAPIDTARPPPELPAPAASPTSFAVKFKDEVSPHPVMGMFVMPGETVPLEVVLGDTLARYSAEAGAGRLERVGPARWRWTAPERKGVSAIVLRDSASGGSVALNAFVMVPRPAGPTIGGFRVGR